MVGEYQEMQDTQNSGDFRGLPLVPSLGYSFRPGASELYGVGKALINLYKALPPDELGNRLGEFFTVSIKTPKSKRGRIWKILPPDKIHEIGDYTHFNYRMETERKTQKVYLSLVKELKAKKVKYYDQQVMFLVNPGPKGGLASSLGD